jgi:hypothetical protein
LIETADERFYDRLAESNRKGEATMTNLERIRKQLSPTRRKMHARGFFFKSHGSWQFPPHYMHLNE